MFKKLIERYTTFAKIPSVLAFKMKFNKILKSDHEKNSFSFHKPKRFEQSMKIMLVRRMHSKNEIIHTKVKGKNYLYCSRAELNEIN